MIRKAENVFRRHATGDLDRRANQLRIVGVADLQRVVDRLQYLRRGPIFRNANIDVLLELANRTQEAHFEPGVTLWEAGHPSGYLYALVSGNVRCTLPDGEMTSTAPSDLNVKSLSSIVTASDVQIYIAPRLRVCTHSGSTYV